MSRYIDADALREEWLYENGTFEPNDVLDSIDCQPTVDAVPVVRCGECKWFDRLEKNHPCGYCHAAKHGYMTSRWEISIYRKCNEDFYCADGERRTE